MYVTRPLSLYKNNPSALSLPPPEGPNGGYLVLQEEDDDDALSRFFGLFKDRPVSDFPIPQNKVHIVHELGEDEPSDHHGSGKDETLHRIYFIPTINRPLASNTYYAIKTKENHKGEACVSSTDEDMTTCCFSSFLPDAKPRPLDPSNIYQQFKLSIYKKGGKTRFLATSVAPDGYPPSFLRRKSWLLSARTPERFSLGEALGLDQGLRARLPDLDDLSLSSCHASTPVVVGKWYCPFMFVKDVLTPKVQVMKSRFYEMTLEQLWERIFFRENENMGSVQGNGSLLVDIDVPTESVTVARKDATRAHNENGGVVWFNSIDGTTSVGLSSLVVERMMWEEARAGWVPKEAIQEKVLRVEDFGGVGMWARYGCYMLVERFVLKRQDGTVVLTYNFNHTNQIRSKWE